MDSLERQEAIFHQVRKVSPERRAAVLEAACAGDEALRRQVEDLIANHDDAGEPYSFSRLSASALVGREVGAFRLLRQIGSGGMGAVFEAEQNEPRRRVALKVLAAGLPSESSLARFRHEAEILARLSHPSIASIVASGTFDPWALEGKDGGLQLPYYAMELVEGGEPLSEWVRTREPSLETLLTLFLSICEGVQHGHQKGVIHRDLKPDNILVDQSGRPRIIDFGVAKQPNEEDAQLTGTGQLLGTLQYMSPEQFDASGAAAVDVRSDVYALGVVLYELVCHRLPYGVPTDSIVGAALAVREKVPKAPASLNRSIPRDLEAVILRALEKAPDDRYATTSEFAADLRRVQRREPVEARPHDWWYVLSRFVARHRLAVSAVCVVFVAALSAAVVSTVALDRSRRAEQHSGQQLDFVSQLLDSVAAVADGPDGELLRLLEEASTQLENTDHEPWVRGTLHHRLARAYLGVGHAVEAAAQCERALELLEASEGGSDATELIDRTRVDWIAARIELGDHFDGMYPLDQDVTSDAESRLAEWMPRWQKSYGPGADLTLRALALSAKIHCAQGRVGEAEEAITSLFARLDPARHSDATMDDAHIARLYLHRIREDFEALEASARAIYELRAGGLHPEHPRTLSAVQLVGGSLMANDRPADALAWLERANRGWERKRDADDLLFVIARLLLADALTATLKPDDREVAERARAIFEEALPRYDQLLSYSTDFAITKRLSYLACLEVLGREETLVAEVRTARDQGLLDPSICPGDHPTIFLVEAMKLLRLRAPEEAVELAGEYLAAVKELRQTSPEDPGRHLLAANVLYDGGRAEQASEMAEVVLGMPKEAIRDPRVPLAAEAVQLAVDLGSIEPNDRVASEECRRRVAAWVASLAEVAGEPAEGKDVYWVSAPRMLSQAVLHVLGPEEALSVIEGEIHVLRRVRPGSRELADSLRLGAHFLSSAVDPEDPRISEWMEESAVAYAARYGPETPLVAEVRADHASLLWVAKRYERSLELYEAAIGEEAPWDEEKYRDWLVLRFNRCTCLVMLQRFDEAEQALTALHDECVEVFGADDPVARGTAENLFVICGLTHRPEEAAMWRKRWLD